MFLSWGFWFLFFFFFFFFQAEVVIRVLLVTGVQTCALPICDVFRNRVGRPGRDDPRHPLDGCVAGGRTGVSIRRGGTICGSSRTGGALARIAAGNHFEREYSERPVSIHQGGQGDLPESAPFRKPHRRESRSEGAQVLLDRRDTPIVESPERRRPRDRKSTRLNS